MTAAPADAGAEGPLVRTPKAYRFPPETIKQIEELSLRLKRSATNVLELAVDRLHQAEISPSKEAP